MEDEVFLMEACRLWRVLYGNEFATHQAARYFASKVPPPKAKGLRFIAKNAFYLATVLIELADELES